MASECPLVRFWAVIALNVLHAAPIVAAFWLGSAAQLWLAATCLVAAVGAAASWWLPALRRRVWAPDAADRGARANAIAGVACETFLGVWFLAAPPGLVFG